MSEALVVHHDGAGPMQTCDISQALDPFQFICYHYDVCGVCSDHELTLCVLVLRGRLYAVACSRGLWIRTMLAVCLNVCGQLCFIYGRC